MAAENQQTNPISDMSDTLKNRISGGLVGNLTICFLTVNWPILIHAVSGSPADVKIAVIGAYIRDNLWCRVIGGTLFALIVILGLQYLGGPLFTWLRVTQKNWMVRIEIDWTVSERWYYAGMQASVAQRLDQLAPIIEDLKTIQKKIKDGARQSELDALRQKLESVKQFILDAVHPSNKQQMTGQLRGIVRGVVTQEGSLDEKNQVFLPILRSACPVIVSDVIEKKVQNSNPSPTNVAVQDT
jgi:hypothetical protein